MQYVSLGNAYMLHFSNIIYIYIYIWYTILHNTVYKCFRSCNARLYTKYT